MKRAWLLLLVLLVPFAVGQSTSTLIEWSAPTSQFLFSYATPQGVTSDGSHVYVFGTDHVAKYTYNGTEVLNRDTTPDGSYGAHTGAGTYHNGSIYVSTSNFPTPLESRRAAVVKYDTNFTFVQEYTPQGASFGAGGGVGSHEGFLWWPFASKATSTSPLVIKLYKIDPVTMQRVADYPLEGGGDLVGYEDVSFVGDYAFLPVHGGAGHDWVDAYHWTGTGFEFVEHVPHVSWTSSNAAKGTEYGSQGLHFDNGSTWFVGRDSAGNAGGSGDVVRMPYATSFVPGAPVNLTATPGPGTVNLTWEEPASDEAITAYRIYRDNEPLADVANLTYEDTGLTAGQAYRYDVTALSAAGESNPSTVHATPTEPLDDGSGGGGGAGGGGGVIYEESSLLPTLMAGVVATFLAALLGMVATREGLIPTREAIRSDGPTGLVISSAVFVSVVVGLTLVLQTPMEWVLQ